MSTTFQPLQLENKKGDQISAYLTVEAYSKKNILRGRAYTLKVEGEEVRLGKMITNLDHQVNQDGEVLRYVQIMKMRNFTALTKGEQQNYVNSVTAEAKKYVDDKDQPDSHIKGIETLFVHCAFLQSIVVGRGGYVVMTHVEGMNEHIRKNFTVVDTFGFLEEDKIEEWEQEKNEKLFTFEQRLDTILEEKRMDACVDTALDAIDEEQERARCQEQALKLEIDRLSSRIAELASQISNQEETTFTKKRPDRSKKIDEFKQASRQLAKRKLEKRVVSFVEDKNALPPPQQDCPPTPISPLLLPPIFAQVEAQIKKCNELIKSIKQAGEK